MMVFVAFLHVVAQVVLFSAALDDGIAPGDSRYSPRHQRRLFRINAALKVAAWPGILLVGTPADWFRGRAAWRGALLAAIGPYSMPAVVAVFVGNSFLACVVLHTIVGA